MKILFGFIAILLIAATYIFITQEDSVEDSSSEVTIVEELNKKNTRRKKQNLPQKINLSSPSSRMIAIVSLKEKMKEKWSSLRKKKIN